MATVRYTLDPNDPPRFTKEQLARLDAMTPEEIQRNAENDPDNPPMTEEELQKLMMAKDVRLLRESIGLSQSQFAERFHVGLPRLRDWEQGRSRPDSVALAYLRVIAQAPETVERALATKAAAQMPVQDGAHVLRVLTKKGS